MLRLEITGDSVSPCSVADTKCFSDAENDPTTSTVTSYPTFLPSCTHGRLRLLRAPELGWNHVLELQLYPIRAAWCGRARYEEGPSSL